MSNYLRSQIVGGQDIAGTDTTQNHPLGMVVEGYDTTLGYGRFMYVKGVASGATGLAVTIIPNTGVTALTVARSKGLVGILMSTLDANTKYGWAQIGGVGEVQVAGSVVAGSTVYTTATGGKLDDAVTTGDIVYGANFTTADGTPVANWARVSLSNPYVGDTDNA